MIFIGNFKVFISVETLYIQRLTPLQTKVSNYEVMLILQRRFAIVICWLFRSSKRGGKRLTQMIAQFFTRHVRTRCLCSLFWSFSYTILEYTRRLGTKLSSVKIKTHCSFDQPKLFYLHSGGVPFIFIFYSGTTCVEPLLFWSISSPNKLDSMQANFHVVAAFIRFFLYDCCLFYLFLIYYFHI